MCRSLFLIKNEGLQLKVSQKRNSFKCIFQGFWPYFQKSYISEEIFDQTTFSVSGCFCILCYFWVKKFKLRRFFSLFSFSASYDNKCDNIQAMTWETYYVTLFRHGYLTIMWFSTHFSVIWIRIKLTNGISEKFRYYIKCFLANGKYL